MELTKSEMEIMDVFWESSQPLSRADLLGDSNKSWKDSSIHILLNGLLKKGLLHEAGVVRCSKTYGRIFEPTMTREEYYAALIFSHRYMPEPQKMLQAILNRPEMSDYAFLLENVV
jgi:BlaI family penicillinase repressor